MALEDFTTYTELDPNSHIEALQTTLILSGLNRNEDAYVYADKGADHFGATFTHEFDFLCDSSGNANQLWVCWAVANVVNDDYYWNTNDSEAIILRPYPTYNKLFFVNKELGATPPYYDTYTSFALDTRYYLTVERTSETAIECRIYSDAARSTLLDTLSIPVTSGRRYRYVFGANTYNDGYNFPGVGDVRNLDLGEGSLTPIAQYYRRLRSR